MRASRFLLLSMLLSVAFAAYGGTKPDSLIVPGERLGPFHLGNTSGGAEHILGEPVSSDAAMGGKGAAWWYLGATRDDKGRQFRRPPQLVEFSQKDMEHDSAAHPGVVTTTAYFTDSPTFHTAGGIAVGSTLDAIRAKYPATEPEPYQDSEYWPLSGTVRLFTDIKDGIGFAIRDGDKRCIELGVIPKGGQVFYRYPHCSGADDYSINSINGSIGDLKLGMTRAKVLSILGKPDQTYSKYLEGDEVWSWHVPAQDKAEPPGLAIYIHKQPDGTAVVTQIAVSSPLFVDEGYPVHPGDSFASFLQGKNPPAKVESDDRRQVDTYAELRAGILFDVRRTDSTCTAISIFSSPMQNHSQIQRALSTMPATP